MLMRNLLLDACINLEMVLHISTAVKRYRKAAEQGDARSQYNLGRMYENGCGVDKNISTAVELYRKAAEQCDAHAQSYLDHLRSASSDKGSEEE